MLSDYCLQLGRTWLSSLYAVRKFADAHGQLPNHPSIWVPLVDRPCDEAAAAVSSPLTTAQALDAVRAAIPYCARRPESAVGPVDKVAVASWLVDQRYEATRGTLSVGKAAIMDALLGDLDWRAQPDAELRDQTWEPYMAGAVVFLRQHGRLSARGETFEDPGDGKVYSVGSWLYRQRIAAPRLTAAQREELDAKLPAWQE